MSSRCLWTLLLLFGLGCSTDRGGENLAALEAKIAVFEQSVADLAALRTEHDALRREMAEIRQPHGDGTLPHTRIECDELVVGGHVVLTRAGLDIGDEQSGPSCSLRSNSATWKAVDGENLRLEPHRLQINDFEDDARIVLELNTNDNDASLFLKKHDAPMIALSAARTSATVGVFNGDELAPSLLAVAEDGPSGKLTALRMIRGGRLAWNQTISAEANDPVPD